MLGAIDHGTRLNVVLRRVRRFNRWTFLGCLLLAIGEFARPEAIKTDNHPVFHSRLVRKALGWCGVALRHSRPARPWENGYIERLFGTFKRCLDDYVIRDEFHLRSALPACSSGTTHPVASASGWTDATTGLAGHQSFQEGVPFRVGL